MNQQRTRLGHYIYCFAPILKRTFIGAGIKQSLYISYHQISPNLHLLLEIWKKLNSTFLPKALSLTVLIQQLDLFILLLAQILLCVYNNPGTCKSEQKFHLL